MTTFYIVRHGETDWNVQGRIQGHSDALLNEKGENQARQRGKELATTHFDMVFSSDLSRTLRTAELIVGNRALTINTSQKLRERFLGELEGRYRHEVPEVYEKYIKLDDHERRTSRRVPSAESDQEIADRFIAFLMQATNDHQNKTILTVTHAGVMRSFLEEIEYATFAQLWNGKVHNTALIVLETDGQNFTVNRVDGIELGDDTIK